ncbi:LuxR C-terminal-related transcriptional regulator [Streptomyces sp. NPDC005970]|uniref:response regulator transcription factor n=1 Tax=Streptomyces sp. NPDC005970 TaxID=3156723 RepID=UPI0034115E26
MPRRIQTMCGAGLHRLDNPRNVYVTFDKVSGKYRRKCRPCALARKRRATAERDQGQPARRELPWWQQLEWAGPHRAASASGRADRRKHTVQTYAPTGHPMEYRPTRQQLEYLQALADGLTVLEVAERLYVSLNAVHNGLYDLRRKYGVGSNAAAVAQGLKRGTIRPDRKTGKGLPRNNSVRTHTRSIRALVRGERAPYRGNAAALARELDTLLSWSEAHAVSVLWGAGRLTSRDVPQTRNRYRRRIKKRREDKATWKKPQAKR